MIRNLRSKAALFGLVMMAAACQDDTLNRPFSAIPVEPMFARYVSMGNSITAGFQSGGILDSTQKQSYAVLLAQAMHTPFYPPYMATPGCPPPYTNVFTGVRLKKPGDTTTTTAATCKLRQPQTQPPPYITNVAVPGAKVISTYNNLDSSAHSNPLTQFFLGGLTQVQAMQRVQPTFVSLWIGNNDVLGAATAAAAGDSNQITPVATFQTQYNTVLSAIDSAAPQGAILVGVANVTDVPYFSAGATYWAIKNHLAPPDSFPTLFTVSANCAPGLAGGRGDTTLVPFPYGAALLGAAAAGAPRNLDCSDSVVAIVTPPELRKLVGTVLAYNAYIASQATAHGWAYLDPNPALDSLHAVAAAVRPFPAIGAACSTNPFGTAFTCDGVHPSAATHRLIARKLRDAINAKYTTAIPPIP